MVPCTLDKWQMVRASCKAPVPLYSTLFMGEASTITNLNFIIILGAFSGPIVALPRTGPRCLVQSEVRLTLFLGH